MKVFGIIVAVLIALCGLTYWGTYNGFQRKDEGVGAKERQIASCYQKRTDLFVNFADTLNTATAHEKSVIIGYAQARSSGARLSPDATPQQIKEFAEKQAAVTGASLINAIRESVPNVASMANFLKLQNDVKQVENQCNVIRQQYIREVAAYNTSIRSFPANVVANAHGYTKKDQIKFDNEEQNKASPRLFNTKK